MIIAAVEPIYLKAISQPYVGLGNKTVWDLLEHLYNTYAKITPSDLKTNDKRMNEPYNPNMPFECLIEQVQDAVDYAAHAGSPYTAKQILGTAYDLVFNTGMFYNDLRDWRRKPAADQTWTNFKTFMTARHSDWREENSNTAGQKYGTANAVHDDSPEFEQRTIDAIANLATATASDRATVASLTSTISELTAELKKNQAKLIEALEKNAKLAAGCIPCDKDKDKENKNPLKGKRPPNRHYCHTHGFLCLHHSGKCPDPAPGHVSTARARDTKGGSQANKAEWIRIVTGNA